MRPQDIIADFLVSKKLLPDNDRRTPDDLALDLIEALAREGLEIDYPAEPDFCG